MKRRKWWIGGPARQKTIVIGGVTATLDVKTTAERQWQSCECEGCNHYRQHAVTAFPPSFSQLLADFGLAPDNAAYTTVTDAFPERKLVRFEGHFVVCGELDGGERTAEFDAGQDCLYWLDQTAWTGGIYDESYTVPHLDVPHFFINFKALFLGELAEDEEE